MSCQDARADLLAMPTDALLDHPHLGSCASCRSLAEALVERHAALDRALSAQPELPASLAHPVPANRSWRWSVSSVALTLAVAATLAVGIRTSWTPLPDDPPAARPPHGPHGPASTNGARGPDARDPVPDDAPSRTVRGPEPPRPAGALPVPPAVAPVPDDGIAGVEPDGPVPDGSFGGPACVPDYLAWEPAAIAGELDDTQVDCLESAFENGSFEKAGRALAVHWFASGDMKRWEDVVERVVERERALKRVDPDLAYKLALHRSKLGSDSVGVVDLTELALARKDVWTGDTLVARTNSLLKVRAVAYQRLLQQSMIEEREDPALRAKAAAAAREWLASLRATGKDVTTAEGLCRSIAPDPSDCDP